jgi:hypothetical protein
MFLGKRLEDGRSVRKKSCECSRMYPTNRTKTLFVGRLVTAFEIDGEHRGFHAGDFEWTVTAGLKVAGRMSGVTNVGTHREPPFKPCQKCDERGVMEGRLCGQVTTSQDPALKRCQVIAAYRIRFDPSRKGGNGDVEGTLEGLIICSSKPF